MAKTNFTKVEESLNEGLRKMSVNNLLEMAAVASQVGVPHSLIAHESEKRQILAALQFEVKHCKNRELFSAGGISRSKLRDFLEHPDELTEEHWALLKTFREKVEVYKKELSAKLPEDADAKLVEAQRKRHINKRYNTKEQWLPLH